MSAEVLFLKQVKAHSAFWMDRPGDWVWSTAAGQPQGFGLVCRDEVGLANLLWLAMDMSRPPQTYDLRHNNLCLLITLHGRKMGLDGQWLFNQAEALSLAQFRNLCRTAKFDAPQQSMQIAPLLDILATRRLEHAHT